MPNKKLKITEKAYRILLGYKLPNETFSDCILRRYGKSNSRKSISQGLKG
ncbi:hypothetical protein HY637_03330 [Candidatus Woesearchaeota archaeon]|nr:hypothetical protein [Candidatus Woesearchaeota archaeon]